MVRLGAPQWSHLADLTESKQEEKAFAMEEDDVVEPSAAVEDVASAAAGRPTRRLRRARDLGAGERRRTDDAYLPSLSPRR